MAWEYSYHFRLFKTSIIKVVICILFHKFFRVQWQTSSTSTMTSSVMRMRFLETLRLSLMKARCTKHPALSLSLCLSFLGLPWEGSCICFLTSRIRGGSWGGAGGETAIPWATSGKPQQHHLLWTSPCHVCKIHHSPEYLKLFWGNSVSHYVMNRPQYSSWQNH